METLTATFKIVTPMFIGGADPNEHAELREPSIKGALRFWYRAIDPDYKGHEMRIFGGTGKEEGQSMFLLRVTTQGTRTGETPWNPIKYKTPVLTHGDSSPRPPQSSGNQGTWNIDGLRYFSYPLNMGDNQRKALSEDSNSFTLSLIFKNTPDPEIRKRILSAIWLLGHAGGLGTRSRRGFGTVALKSWSASNPNAWPELDNLPIAHEVGTPDKWLAVFRSSLTVLQGWFGQHATPYRHSVFGGNSKFKLHNTGKDKWYDALAEAGQVMQEFRQRYSLSDPNSDYFRVKKHLVANNPGANSEPGAAVGSAALSGNGPDRTAFGLPLTFQYSSLKYYTHTDSHGKRKYKTPNTTFQGKDHDRSASRLHVRIIHIGDRCYPFYIRLDGPLLHDGENIKEQRGGTATYPVPSDGILADFWKSLTSYSEVLFP